MTFILYFHGGVTKQDSGVRDHEYIQQPLSIGKININLRCFGKIRIPDISSLTPES